MLYWISALNSASVQSLHMPFAGIAFLPFLTDSSNLSAPCARRGFHAAASPSLGAPAAPVAWQNVQDLSYFALIFGSTACAETDRDSKATATATSDFFMTRAS
jgi:hypothetical protein